MKISIHLTRPTVKKLMRHLQRAYATGHVRLVRRISALLDLARGDGVTQVAERHAVSRQVVYDWLKVFLLQGEASLVYRQSPGRKSRLTKTQKGRLAELIKASPQVAGFGTACWTSSLIQLLIQTKRCAISHIERRRSRV